MSLDPDRFTLALGSEQENALGNFQRRSLLLTSE
ncbi:hypothetical protein NK6_4526 [Bradyrhizobium diazoefficiens]|uniref:Uncharacterized protein n=1 Tax=Bradyrhizobium diazoefficiens TaxID=1355477 RepID=A0A0E4FVY5_9BRAD|nr:hypothetical protein NK6_4526 [Bradyrhizobium diazoefficiens]